MLGFFKKKDKIEANATAEQEIKEEPAQDMKHECQCGHGGCC